jgi:hypothetical protein
LNLPADDVFYFGNSIGDSGNSTTDANVNAADVLGARGHATATASMTNVWDYNRDKVVDALDVTIAQSNITAGAAVLKLITPPLAGGGAVAIHEFTTGNRTSLFVTHQTATAATVNPSAELVDLALSVSRSTRLIDPAKRFLPPAYWPEPSSLSVSDSHIELIDSLLLSDFPLRNRNFAGGPFAADDFWEGFSSFSSKITTVF